MPTRATTALVSAALAFALAWPAAPRAEDIDVFVGQEGSDGDSDYRPNLLIVIDNTSNWSRQSQQWPGGLTQGESEVRAIRNALAGLTDRVNVGLMMFVTEGNANDNGGYVRHSVQQLTSSSQYEFNAKLAQIEQNINDPAEKRNSHEEYGFLMHDVYQYLAGGNAFDTTGTSTPEDRADARGYQAILPTFSRFASPLTSRDLCNDTYIVFIGNPNSSGPASDTSANSRVLRAIAGEGYAPDRLASETSGTPLPIPEFVNVVSTESTALGPSGACYKNTSDCTKDVADEDPDLCAGYDSCACAAAVPATGCGKGKQRFAVTGERTTISVEETGESDWTAGQDWNFDDWAKLLFVKGIPVGPDGDRIRAVTYTIDVFNKQQNADHTGLMMSAARVGGGRYFAARNEQAIEVALGQILSEILSVNSTFASSALPISATNRAQNENQVFIGMFRPDKRASPQWFGNLKRYRLAYFDGDLDLGDSSVPPRRAVNRQTGFVSECAASFWTRDSGNYWENKAVDPAPRSECVGSTTNPFSDLPDGPFVEKGASAQVLRDSGPTGRTVLTLHGGVLTELADAPLEDYFSTAALRDYVLGWDDTMTASRHTIHGDVVHSRPLPVNYGETGVTVYYGGNNGPLHAIDAATGAERWAFIAPEHLQNQGARFERLKTGAPRISYPTSGGTPTSGTPKDYFFDGLIGQVVDYDADNNVSRAWIYPSMRRGGRMLYGLDVTDPSAPELLWRAGCPSLSSDEGCRAADGGDDPGDWVRIGQTWSFPNTGYIAGYRSETGPRPVVVMGGGYAACEDAADRSPPADTDCAADDKGRGVYVIDAADGTLLRFLPTERAVPADVSLVDANYDGKADYAYAADTGGGLYRISFVAVDDPPGATLRSLGPEEWSILKIAGTSGGYRKFLNGPAVMPYKGQVYVALGSGNRERPLAMSYPYTTPVQDRFYVFLDSPKDGLAGDGGPYPYDLDGSSLYDHTRDKGCGQEEVIPPPTRKGWFMNLPGTGEQTVTTGVIIGGMVTFSTTRPRAQADEVEPSSDGLAGTACPARPLGVATGYWVNLFNASGAIGVDGTCGGIRSIEFAGGGIPPSPVVATVRVDGITTTVVIGAAARDASVETVISPQVIMPAIPENRARVFRSTDIDR